MNRDDRTIKKEINKIGKIGTRKNGFTNVTKNDLKKINRVITNNSGLINKQLFKEADVMVNKERNA